MLADVAWSISRDGQIQLKLRPSVAIRKAASPADDNLGDDFDRLTVFEGQNDEKPESELVRRFHALRFDRSQHRATSAELSYARELLATYNPALINRLLPRIADAVREGFPDGKLINAARPYVEQFISDQQTQEARRESEAAAFSQQNNAERKAGDEGKGPRAAYTVRNYMAAVVASLNWASI